MGYSTIICGSLEDFAFLVARFYREGLAFTANSGTLTITLTGY
jgi:hypothetical protein